MHSHIIRTNVLLETMGIRLDQYVGRTAEIIYEDKHGAITQRRIIVRSNRDGVLHATCLKAGAWRPFRLERILSWQPVRGERREWKAFGKWYLGKLTVHCP